MAKLFLLIYVNIQTFLLDEPPSDTSKTSAV